MPRIIDIPYSSREKRIPLKNIAKGLISALLGIGLYCGVTTPIKDLCIASDIDELERSQALQSFAMKQGYSQKEIQELGYTGQFSCNQTLFSVMTERIRAVLH